MKKEGKQWGSTSDIYRLQESYDSLEMEGLYRGTVNGFSIPTLSISQIKSTAIEKKAGRKEGQANFSLIHENFLLTMARISRSFIPRN